MVLQGNIYRNPLSQGDSRLHLLQFRKITEFSVHNKQDSTLLALALARLVEFFPQKLRRQFKS